MRKVYWLKKLFFIAGFLIKAAGAASLLTLIVILYFKLNLQNPVNIVNVKAVFMCLYFAVIVVQISFYWIRVCIIQPLEMR